VQCRRLLLIFVAITVLGAAEESTRKLVARAKKAEKAGNFSEAYLLYSQAALRKAVYHQKAMALESKALAAAAGAALPALKEDLAADPDPILASISDREMQEARELLPPPILAGKPDRKSFQLKEDPIKLFELVAAQYGLQAIADPEYQGLTQPVRFEVQNADYREALNTLCAATGSFIVPLTPKRFLVVKDTQQKRQEKEPTVAVTISLPQPFSLQDAQELARAVQQLMEIQKLTVDSARRIVLMRDRVSKVRPAQQIYEQLLTHRPTVVIDVEILESNSSYSRDIGISLPTAVQLFNMNFMQSPLSRWFGVIGITLGQADIVARMAESMAKSVNKSELRSVQGQPATLHIGDRYPILTAGYFGAAPDATGTVYRPPPSFNYEDLGLTVKITPWVHGTEEMTLDIETEYKLLGNDSANGIPVISNRKFSSRVRMKNNEWAIVSGLTTMNDTKTITGHPGLIHVPFLRTNSKQQIRGEALVLLKPRLLSLPPSEFLTKTVWLGSEGRPLLPL
jgi:general secretion pathway protein D